MNRSIGDIILTGGVCLFASWTVACYIAVFSHSGFSDLMTWWFVPLATGLGLTYLCIDRSIPTDATCTAQPARLTLPFTPKTIHYWALLALGVVVAILRIVNASYFSIWLVLLCAAILIFRIASAPRNEQTPKPITHSNWQRVGILVLIALGAILAAITHRPDLDDSQYLNFVVTALDFPSEALYSHSGLWLDRTVPLESPIYRFHSYELLVAAFSYAFEVDHKIFYYLLLPPLFGGVAVLVHWRLAQHLIPRYALSFVLVWLVLLIALGESHRVFGNFSFVRLYQGKGLLVTVALPLCLLLGLQFSESPNWRRGLALSMAAIASLGVSSSALVTVPIVLAATLAGGLPSASLAAAKRIIIGGVASSLVLIAIGIFLVMKMGLGGDTHGNVSPSASQGLFIVLGKGFPGTLILTLFPIAPLFVMDYRRRRIYATTTVFYVLAVMNPWTSPFIASMFDLALQWRILWSVPLVISTAIALIGLTVLVSKSAPRLRYPVVVVAILATLLLLSPQWSISPDNNVVIAFPSYKVEPAEHSLASEIVHDAPQQSVIYAPMSVAAWITTFRSHPYPLLVRHEYIAFGRTRQYIGMPEIHRRRRVVNFLEGHDQDVSTPAFFKTQLEIDKPSFVVYESHIEMAAEIGSILNDAGYTGEMHGPYWAWRHVN